jgi:hypothetical protein
MLYRLLLGTLFLLGGILPLHAQADEQLQLTDLVDEGTLLVASLNVKQLDVAKVFDTFAPFVGFTPSMRDKLRGQLTTFMREFDDAGATHVLVVYTNRELGDMPLLIIPVTNAGKASALGQKLLAMIWPQRLQPPAGSSQVIGNRLIIGPPASVARWANHQPQARADFAAAFATAKPSTLQVFLAPNADCRKVLAETIPALPPELGGGSTALFTQKLQWAALTVSTAPQFTGKLRVQASDGPSAEALSAFWKQWLNALHQFSQGRQSSAPVWKIMHQLFSAMQAEVKDTQFVVSAEGDKLKALTEVVAKGMSSNALEQLNTSNLRQHLIAMHNYHNDYGRLPNQAICDKKGKPLLSWRVALLPYLEQDHLWKQFKHDEAWDSPHNIKLLDQMPKIYEHPFAKNVKPNHTLYQVFYSLKGTKPGAAIIETGTTTLGRLTVEDGTSNTFVLTDAASEAVPWTKPVDLLFDGTVANLPNLASPAGTNWAHVAFGDAHTSRFKITARAKLLWQFIGRNDGSNEDATEVYEDK